MAAAGIAWASNQDRASESQVLEAVKLLVEELGADVNAVSDLGETAMHAAAYRGANSVVQYLFDKGAKLDVVAVDGRTPLIVADGVEYGNSFAAQPHTAVLLRKLGAKEMTMSASVRGRDPGKSASSDETTRLALIVAVLCACRRSRRAGTSAAPLAADPAGSRQPQPAIRAASRRARQVLRHLPQPANEDRRTRARRVGPGAGERPRRGVGKGRAQDSDGGDAAGWTSAAGQSARRAASRRGSRRSSTGPPSSTPTRAGPHCIVSTASNIATPSATCSRSRSIRRRCCRQTTRRTGSTTTPMPCRCRRPWRSDTWVRRRKSARWRWDRFGDPPSPETVFVPTDRNQGSRFSEDLPWGSRGGLAIRYYFPVDGEYLFQLRLNEGGAGGGIMGLTAEPHQLDVSLDRPGLDVDRRRAGIREGDRRGAHGERSSRRFSSACR